MARLVLAPLFAFFAVVGFAQSVDPDPCASVSSCIARIYDVAEPPRSYAQYISPPEHAVVERLLLLGEEAVEPLAQLLNDPNEDVAQVAAYVLKDVEHIDEALLPLIVDGLDRELPWLPPALGHMDSSDAAREAVVRFLAASTSPLNQEANAVRLSGVRAIPHLLAAARCELGTCDERHFDLLFVAFRELGPERSTAGPELINIVRGQQSDVVAGGVLKLIAALGVGSRQLDADLVAIRSDRPALTEAVNDALIGIYSPFSADVFAERLRREPDEYEFIFSLRDLADVGRTAVGAGPAVAELLDSELWIRLPAARAIGFIGYDAAAPDLIPLLNDPVDVRLNWVAAESLGRLRYADAEPALMEVAASHWYAPVRQAAATALASIRGELEMPSRPVNGNFSAFFFEFDWVSNQQAKCQNLAGLEMLPLSTGRILPEDDPELFESFVFESRYGPRTAHAAWPVEGGWLAGSDYGEWSGELVYVDDAGNQTLLIDFNIVTLVPFENGYAGVAGVSHLGLSSGQLYKVYRDERGNWVADEWRQLPSAPDFATVVDSGELLVDLTWEGTLLVSTDGTIRMAPCAD